MNIIFNKIYNFVKKSILFIVIIIVFFICFGYKKTYIQENMENEAPKIYITLTTIPERLSHEWFYNNLKNLINLNGDYTVLLNIPYKWKKTGAKYIIPDNIKQLEDGDNLIINRVDEDYGPITKLLGAILNDKIHDNSCLLICDDDIKYKDNFVVNLYNEYKKDDTKIYTSCYDTIEGYKGFMVKKSIIKPILNYNRPESCFRIDDDYINEIVRNKLNIKIIAVPYGAANEWSCSFDINVHDNETTNWEALKTDNRSIMVDKCIEDIIIPNHP